MKQYIMGMITGASLILCAVMFIGATEAFHRDNTNNGHFQAFGLDGEAFLLDTRDGDLYQYVLNPKTNMTALTPIYSPRLINSK